MASVLQGRVVLNSCRTNHEMLLSSESIVFFTTPKAFNLPLRCVHTVTSLHYSLHLTTSLFHTQSVPYEFHYKAPPQQLQSPLLFAPPGMLRLHLPKSSSGPIAAARICPYPCHLKQAPTVASRVDIECVALTSFLWSEVEGVMLR